MKNIVAIVLSFISIISIFTSSVYAYTVPVTTANELNYWDMAVGHEYTVYGRGTSCMNDNLDFISMCIGGKVVNFNSKAVYSNIVCDYSYTHYHTLTTRNSQDAMPISELSIYNSNGTRDEPAGSYVELINNYSSNMPNIVVNATCEAYRNQSNRYVSYPNVNIAC